jgi:hypothetical protein
LAILLNKRGETELQGLMRRVEFEQPEYMRGGGEKCVCAKEEAEGKGVAVAAG